MGKVVEVKITSAGKHFLIGEPILEALLVQPTNVPQPLVKGQVSGLSSAQVSCVAKTCLTPTKKHINVLTLINAHVWYLLT